MKRKSKRQQQAAFEATPLITPERLRALPQEIFNLAACPPWVGSVFLFSTNPDDEEDTSSMQAIIPVGGVNPVVVKMSTLAAAVLFELSRSGHSFAANSNHGTPPKVYLKMSFRGAAHLNVNARRILFGAVAGEATKALWQEHDLDPENTYVEPDPHPRNDSRAVALEEVERLVARRQADGTWPEAHSAKAYLANLGLLFRLLDESAGLYDDDLRQLFDWLDEDDAEPENDN
ncbi:hypothetical protein [Kumtagia ephedrae]|uniref:Uncharacterized protein n=1 Tax=Kumtagia ephedrae TaxID=2116701 RepID=A0A2P7RNB4_9HYPH|nr:hypothetical protein [Mesorhizobium ephedrae]PSJ51690.1 hypothetical protein C7I84_27230 [Mesorhizobium ephedrae]